MKNITRVVFFLAIAGIFLTGCKKDDVNGPGNNTNPPASYPTPTTFNGVTPANVLAVVRVSTIANPSIPPVDASVGVAMFGSPGTDKGDVKVRFNNADYPFTKSTSTSGSVTYTYTPSASNPTGIPLNTGYSDVTFSATGYTLTNGTVTVPGQMLISTPAANATVPRTAALTVTWANNSNSGMGKAIFISDKNGKSIFKDNATGTTAEFTAAELGTLAAGTALVYVITYTYVLSNSNATVLLGESISFNSVTLQ